jgi:hypothetical protein
MRQMARKGKKQNQRNKAAINHGTNIQKREESPFEDVEN